MTKNSRPSFSELAKQQGAMALLTATFAFLRENDISNKFIVESTRQPRAGRKLDRSVREYRRLVRAYEDMGMVISTWFSLPRFLDKDGRPLTLSVARGSLSIRSLVR